MQLFYKLFVNYFKPTFIKQSIQNLDANLLKQQGIKLLLLDLDNTLVSHNDPNSTPKVIEYFQKLKEAGIISIIASNNCKDRVTFFAHQIPSLNHFIFCSMKPKKWKIQSTLKKHNYNFQNHEIMMVGDRYLTDIWVGRKLKIKTCLMTEFHPEFQGWKNCEKYWLQKHLKQIQ